MAKHGKIRTLVEYGAARSVLAVVGSLPTNQAISLGKALGRAGYLFAGNLRRTADTNLKLAFPEKTSEERREIMRGCFENLGRELGVFSKFSNGSGKSLLSVIEPEGLEYLEAARNHGNGVILFTGHLGAWELTSFGFSLLGHPFSFLVRRIDNEKIEGLIDRYRTTFGNKTLDKFSAARSMVKILRSGEVLGLLLDLNTLDDEGIFVDFFGVPASTNFVVAKLALRTQSPILPLFALWNAKRGKFLLQLHPPVSVEVTGNEDDDVRNLTAKLTLIIEQQIRRYPDQWLWIHRRWKTRPPGEPSIY
jgi:Kdo2-lipid IVA lauroyltransferase/acyltransferase